MTEPLYCGCRWDSKTRKRIPCREHKREPWKPKRPRYTAMSPRQIYEVGKAVEDPMASALFYLLYLTGARINEAAQFKPMHVTVTPDFYRIRMTVLKKRRVDLGSRIAIIPRGTKAKCYENEMVLSVLEFLRGKQVDAFVFKKWKNMSEYLARKIVITTEAKVKRDDGVWYTSESYEKRLHPHLLRHCRATHLAEVYGFTDTKLRTFFEWADARNATIYTSSISLESSF